MRISSGALVVCALALASAVGCSATAPSSQLTAITITPARDALYLGEAVDFRAVGHLSNGSTREVMGTWTVSGPALAQETAAGRVRGAGLGSASVLFNGEGLFAERPLGVVDDLRGEWTGTLHFETCNRISGTGPSNCKNTFGHTDYPEFSITAQTGRQFTIGYRDNNYIGSFPANVDISRAVQIEEGAATWIDPTSGAPHVYTFSNWNIRIEGSPGPDAALVGTVTVDRKHGSGAFLQHYNDQCTLRVKRQ